MKPVHMPVLIIVEYVDPGGHQAEGQESNGERLYFRDPEQRPRKKARNEKEEILHPLFDADQVDNGYYGCFTRYF